MPRKNTTLARKRRYKKSTRATNAIHQATVLTRSTFHDTVPYVSPINSQGNAIVSTPRTSINRNRRKSPIKIRNFTESPEITVRKRKLPPRNTNLGDMKGRRFYTPEAILEIMLNSFEHGKECTKKGSTLQISSERLTGVEGSLSIFCTCEHVFHVSSDTGRVTIPANEAVIWAAHSSGIGYSGMKTIMQILEIPFMKFELYQTLENRVHELFQHAKEMHLAENGKLEYELSRNAGDFQDMRGEKVVCTTVQVDGGYSKRSYGHGYSANSGVGVIIGMRSKKIIWMSTRNKHCYQCTVNLRTGNIKIHKCYRNWDGPSPAMETDIIREGFKNSLMMHNLVYSKMIGDGDSSVFADVEYIYPGIRVEKLECVNHFIRNLTTKIYNIAQNKLTTKNYPRIPKHEQNTVIRHREKITIGVRKAIEHNSANRPITSYRTLIEDFENVLNHVFGEHRKCKPYFCTKETEGDPMSNIKKCAFYKPLNDAIRRGVQLAPRLIHNCISNDAEHFMSLCSKYTTGKRVYYSHRGGYNMRMTSAMFTFDDSSFWPEKIYRTLYHSSPTTPWGTARDDALKIKAKRDSNSARYRPRRKLYSSNVKTAKPSSDYGSAARDADISDEILNEQIRKLYAELQVDSQKQAEIELETRNQSDSSSWFTSRRERITASNAKRVFRLQDSTNNKSIINTLLFPSDLEHVPSIQYGRVNENNAIRKYEKLNNVIVTRCGLIVSLENGILGASPDGLVGDDGILEIKCPSILDGKLPEAYSTECRKNPFMKLSKKTNKYELVKSHQYYFQIIMLLHVTRRKWCDLMVWSTGPKHIQSAEQDGFALIIRVVRDTDTENLWEKMTEKFVKFWFEEIAPELIDSRKSRSMPYRQPAHRIEAIALKNSKKSSKISSLSDPNTGPSSSTLTNLKFVPPPEHYSDSE